MTPLLAVSFELARPLWLFVLLLAPVFVALTLRTTRGKLGAGDIAAMTARLVLLAIVALALSVPRIRRDAAFRSVAYVLDVSESIPPEATQDARDFIMRSNEKRGEKDDTAFVVFAEGAAVESPFSRISQAARLEAVPIDPANIASQLPRGETDVDGALRLTRASFPPGGARRVVLATDGNQTTGDGVAAVREMLASGLDVQVYPLRYERKREVLLRKLVAPPRTSPGQMVPVRLIVSSTHDNVPARISLRVDDVEVAVSNEVLRAGAENVFELGYAFPESGFYSLEARVDPEVDGNPRNNVGIAATEVVGPGRILFAAAQPDSPLAAALVEELGIPVDVVSPDGLPIHGGGYVPYDCVVLDDVPAYAFSPVQHRMLAAAVRDLGIGLVCAGGTKAFGPGAYGGTELEAVLPLSSEIRNKRVLPSGALVVILHTCEFPGGNEAARKITKAALSTLSAQDEFGVVQWGMGGDDWVVKLQRVRDPSRMHADIDAAQPMDMPSFDGSLQLAAEALGASKSAVKHIVIISDGDPQPPNLKLAAKIKSHKITISTVCVDPHSKDGNRIMKQLSMEAGGNHYDVASANVSRLPQIFMKEAVTVRRSAWRDEAFAPTLTSTHEMLRGLDDNQLPALGGYTVTTLKQNAELLMAAPHDDPLMAWWRHGLGESVAWASDANERWASDWIAWGGFAKFWAQVVRSTSRSLERTGVSIRSDVDAGTAHVVMDALTPDGSFENGLDVVGVVIKPSGETDEFRVVQTGPGRYAGDFPATDVGTYLASLRYTKAGAAENAAPRQALAGVSVAYSAEHLAQRSSERFFALLEAAGATILEPDPPLPADGSPAPDAADEPWTGPLVSSAEPVEIWPWLAALAALLLVMDVAVRRLRLKLPQFLRRPTTQKVTTTRPKPPPRAEQMARPSPGAYVAPTSIEADEKSSSDAPAAAPPAARPDRKDAGLLGAKRRAKKKQDWEENP